MCLPTPWEADSSSNGTRSETCTSQSGTCGSLGIHRHKGAWHDPGLQQACTPSMARPTSHLVLLVPYLQLLERVYVVYVSKAVGVVGG